MYLIFFPKYLLFFGKLFATPIPLEHLILIRGSDFSPFFFSSFGLLFTVCTEEARILDADHIRPSYLLTSVPFQAILGWKGHNNWLDNGF